MPNARERACFIGVDLTSAEKKPTDYVALDRELHLTLFDFLFSDCQIIEAIERYQPSIVAIDAPLSLPNGLCCLEESCPCQSLSSAKGRVCERDSPAAASPATTPQRDRL
ncbi:MAG: DUF429 domain-containing protein [Dehalococcoidia bacterium]|nr:DUF429 domain-containing protein [Dehalococcoidia bacterium]